MRKGHLIGGEHGLLSEENHFQSLQTAMEKMRKEVEGLLSLRHEFFEVEVELPDGEMGDMSGANLPPRRARGRRAGGDGMFEEGISLTYGADSVTAKSQVDWVREERGCWREEKKREEKKKKNWKAKWKNFIENQNECLDRFFLAP